MPRHLKHEVREKRSSETVIITQALGREKSGKKQLISNCILMQTRLHEQLMSRRWYLFLKLEQTTHKKKETCCCSTWWSRWSCWRIPNGLCEVISGTKQPAIRTTWVTRKSSDFHRIWQMENIIDADSRDGLSGKPDRHRHISLSIQLEIWNSLLPFERNPH